jgi:WD40 repeat protein
LAQVIGSISFRLEKLDEVKAVYREGGRWWAVKYSPDGQLIAASGAGGTVLLWDMNHDKELCALNRHSGSVYAVEFCPKGNLLATGGMDGVVRLWGPTGYLWKGWGEVGELRFQPD